jgi:hypothetical protein
MSLSATYGTDAWLREAQELLTQHPCPVCGNNALAVDWDFRLTLGVMTDRPDGVTKEALITCEACGKRFRGKPKI